MTNPLEFEKFYVRQCYDEYYRYILKIWNNGGKRYVTLTGTPGIGISVFYLYFLHRYRQEFPSTTIITASFRNRKLKDCYVFRPGASIEEYAETIPKFGDAIHLYDSPPEVEPGRNRMVCFTSLNIEWLSLMENNKANYTLYMPTWTLNELLECNDILNLGIDPSRVEERFQLFGGVARYCFETDRDTYDIAVASFTQKLESVTSFDFIKRCLKNEAAIAEISHRVFHHIPKSVHSPYPRHYQMVFCSGQAARMVDRFIEDRSDSERAKLAKWLSGKSEHASFMGWLFEGHAREILGRGGEFPMIALIEPKQSPSVSHNVVTISMESGRYTHIPNTTSESIDGYYLDGVNGHLFLFQMTRSYQHPVKARAIVRQYDILKKEYVSLNWKNIKIYLVFVVPRCMAINYRRQVISCGVDGSDFAKDSNVATIPGIGPAKATKLGKINITTVSQLDTAMQGAEKQKFSGYKALFDNFIQELIEYETHRGFCQSISQFVLELSCDYK